MRSDSDLSKLVNQSGFPLQLAIDSLVSKDSDQLGWKVLYREHGWRHGDGQSGFIDLVLEDRHGSSVLALECKRVLEADWIFLDDTPVKPMSKRTRLWITNTKEHGREYSGYYDARAFPESPESMFCVVAGQDPKARPMLERIAAEIASATESLALEECQILTKRGYGLRMYAPVIVTTARLIRSCVDPSAVDLRTGEAASVVHTVQPWVRFRKQFSAEFAVEPKNTDWDFAEVASAKEKMVYVVNIESLAGFLTKWEVANNSLRTLR